MKLDHLFIYQLETRYYITNISMFLHPGIIQFVFGMVIAVGYNSVLKERAAENSQSK